MNSFTTTSSSIDSGDHQRAPPGVRKEERIGPYEGEGIVNCPREHDHAYDGDDTTTTIATTATISRYLSVCRVAKEASVVHTVRWLTVSMDICTST